MRHHFEIENLPQTKPLLKISFRFISVCFFSLILWFLLFVLFGCSIKNYTGKFSDGSETHAWICKFGTDTAVKDFSGSVNKDGSRSFALGSSDSNQTAGMEQANQFISTIVEGAVKGAAAGLKP
jgi:hypothetical protein